MPMPATMLWNGITAHIVLRQAELRATGVAIVHEMFTQIMRSADTMQLSSAFKVELLRAIGVAIVKQGNMHPTMEQLLRHAVSYLGMKGHPACHTEGVLDSVENFIDGLLKLRPAEQKAVLAVHVLAICVSGDVTKQQRRFWKRVCHALPATVAVCKLERVGVLCEKIWRLENLDADMFYGAFEADFDTSSLNLEGASWRKFKRRFLNYLTF